MLEVIFELVVEVLIYIVSYYTGKILILVFTLGKYSSERFKKSARRGWKNNSFIITNTEKNEKQISFNYTCIIGFLFWVVFICIIVIKYVVLSD